LSFQATYAVYDLNFDKTYEKLQDSKDVSGLLDISRGTFSFWVNIDKLKVRVQITNNGNVNIWHSEKFYINKAAEKLKTLIVVADGEICQILLLTNLQKIGSTKIACPVNEEVRIDTRTTQKITSVADILKEVTKWKNI
jgi:hypothetical protein